MASKQRAERFAIQRTKANLIFFTEQVLMQLEIPD